MTMSEAMQAATAARDAGRLEEYWELLEKAKALSLQEHRERCGRDPAFRRRYERMVRRMMPPAPTVPAPPAPTMPRPTFRERRSRVAQAARSSARSGDSPDDELDHIERRHLRPVDDRDGYASGSHSCPWCGSRLVWEFDKFVCPDGCDLELDELAVEREAER